MDNYTKLVAEEFKRLNNLLESVIMEKNGKKFLAMNLVADVEVKEKVEEKQASNFSCDEEKCTIKQPHVHGVAPTKKVEKLKPETEKEEPKTEEDDAANKPHMSTQNTGLTR